MTSEQQEVHALIDHLAPPQVAALRGLLANMLSPLDRKLALAPADDEPLTPEQAAAVQAGIASLEQNGGVPLQDVLADFGLTLDDFQRMAETPLPDSGNGNG
jgi:hypothetical protein